MPRRDQCAGSRRLTLRMAQIKGTAHIDNGARLIEVQKAAAGQSIKYEKELLASAALRLTPLVANPMRS